MLRNTCLLTLLLTFIFSSFAHAEVITHLTFYPSSSSAISGNSKSNDELEIDSNMSIRWDNPGFLADLARKLGNQSSGDSIIPQIEELKSQVTQVVELQGLLIKAKTVAMKLNRAKKSGQENLKKLEAQRNSANSALSSAGVPFLENIRKKYKKSDPVLFKKLSEAILENSYQPFGNVLKEETERLGLLLTERINAQGQVEVLMTASIHSSDGKLLAVHLDGYDRYDVTGPVPFNRFQTSIDERTANELASAESMAAVVKKAQKGELRNEAKQALEELNATAMNLEKTVKADVLVGNLNEFLDALKSAEESNLSPIVVEATEIRDSLKTLIELSKLSAPTEVDQLIEISGEINKLLSRFEKLAALTPSNIQAFLDEFEKELKKRPSIISQEIQAALTSAIVSLKSSCPAITQLESDAKSVLSALGLVAKIGSDIDQSLQKPRALLTNASLDTYLDLQTIPGERHPGDYLNIQVSVSRNKLVIDSGRKSFRLEAYGSYVETRGALLFVNPRDKSKSGQEFEPAPGLAFNYHYGWKNSPFWNHIMRPGIGVSLAMLDFDDSKSLEVGIGVNVTLLKDIFWVGYGRNLQAKTDYFYIGINPLVVGRLFSQSTGSSLAGW